jgi:hypothetical protein
MAGPRIVIPMRFAIVLQRLSALRMSLTGLQDPLPPAAVDLFNRLLEEARKCPTRDYLVDEIPHADPEISRAELIMWIGQMRAGLTAAN